MKRNAPLFLGFLVAVLLALLKLLLVFFGFGAVVCLAFVAFALWLIFRRRR